MPARGEVDPPLGHRRVRGQEWNRSSRDQESLEVEVNRRSGDQEIRRARELLGAIKPPPTTGLN
jgi:hypothetical protein